jgi:hypothetical protein
MAFTLGVVVTSGAKIAWNCATNNNEAWCMKKPSQIKPSQKARLAAA